MSAPENANIILISGAVADPTLPVPEVKKREVLSATMAGLRRYWRKAGKKQRETFIQWINSPESAE